MPACALNQTPVTKEIIPHSFFGSMPGEKFLFYLKIVQPYDADVLIAGAGPAGASAAAYLARSGLKVVLIDKCTFPRDKVCGDFVSPVALVELQRLGVVENPAYLQTNLIYSASVHLDGKELITSQFPDISGLPAYGRVIPRVKLDTWIVEAAREAGAMFFEGWRVKGYDVDVDGVTVRAQKRGKQRTWRGRVLIGADGSNSLITRQLHGKLPSSQDRIIAVRSYYEGISGPSDQAGLFFSSNYFPGYYWLFPTGGTRANVGIGMLLDTVPASSEHLPQLLEKLIEQDPAFGDRLANARRVGKITGWPLSTYNSSSPLVADRVLLVGDAAGLINPLNGEGIQYALLSGRWAADTILKVAACNDFSQAKLLAYADCVHRELHYDMALAGLIVRLIRNRSLNPLWMQALRVIISRARVDPTYADITGGILAGVEPASSAIQFRILGGTVQQAVLTLGIGAVKHTLRGPGHLLHEGMRTASASVNVAADIVRHPGEYAQWSAGVTLGLAELASQVVKHLVVGDSSATAVVPSYSPHVHPVEQDQAATLRIIVR
jgi:geranylgeranyl reductase family protein